MANKRLFEETGQQNVYIPMSSAQAPNACITDILAAISREVALAVMVNFVETGLDALADVSDEFGNKLMILVIMLGSAPCNQNKVALLPRHDWLPGQAGADMVMTMFAEKKDPNAYFNFIQTIQKQKLPLGKIKPVLSTVGGGLSPLNVGKLIEEIW